MADVITSILTAGGSVSVGSDLFVFDVTAGSVIDVVGQLGGVGTATAGGDISAGGTAITNIISPTGILTVGDGGIRPSIQSPGGSSVQHSITISSIVAERIDFNGNQFQGIGGLFAGGRLTIDAASLRFDGEIGVGVSNFDGADGFGNSINPADGRGGNGGIFIVNTLNDLFVGENISATTGLNVSEAPNVTFGGAGGQVTLNAGTTLNVDSLIQVSSNDPDPGQTPIPVRRSASGGNITLHSGATTGPAITLSATSQLLALLDDAAPGTGGTIRITSEGGDIVADGRIEANRGAIIISNDPNGVFENLAGGSMISIDGLFASLTSETLQIASGGDLSIGATTRVDLNSVTVALSAVNIFRGGVLDLTADGDVLVTHSTGNVDLTAGSAIMFESIAVARQNNGRSTGLNTTITAGANLDLTDNLSVHIDGSGLMSGGNLSVRSVGAMNLGLFSSVQLDTNMQGTAEGLNTLIDAGTSLTAPSFFASTSIQDGSINLGGNITVNAAGNASFLSNNNEGGLTLLISLVNDATVANGANIAVNIGGNMVADQIDSTIAGLGSIAVGGNIDFTIGGTLTSSGFATFTIRENISFNPEPFGAIQVGPSIRLSAANIRVGNLSRSADLTAFIADNGNLLPPSGLTGSVLVETPGTIDITGSLNVLGSVIAGGNITAAGISSTSVTSNTQIAAGFSGINRFGLNLQDFQRPVEVTHTLTAPIITSLGGINFNGLDADGDFAQATNGGALVLNVADGNFGPSGIEGSVTFNGGNGSNVTGFEAGNGGSLLVDATGAINVGLDIEASSGLVDATINAPQGFGGQVELNSANGAVTVTERIEVSSAPPSQAPSPSPGSRRLSARGGNITIRSGRSAAAPGPSPTPRAVAINIGNTSQLLALLDASAPGPGGKITIQATGANTDVNVNGRLEATRGTVDIRHEADGGRVNIGGRGRLRERCDHVRRYRESRRLRSERPA